MAEERRELEREEDVEEILRMAVVRDANTTLGLRERLEAAAEELGISPDALAKAEREYYDGKIERERWQRFLDHRTKDFRNHMGIWIAVCSGLAVLNLLTTGFRPPWFLFPTVAWGIAVGIHFVSLIASKGDALEKEYEKWLDGSDE